MNAALALLQGLADPAFMLARDGCVFERNRAAEALAESLAGEVTEAEVNAAVSNGAKITVSLADGTAPRWFELSMAAIGGAEGAVLVLAREITLERNLRDALMDSRRRYKDLVEIASDFAWETDIAGAFTFVSPAKVLGRAAASMIGRRPAHFLVDPEHEQATLPFEATEPVTDSEFWAIDADGKPHCLATSARPAFDLEGRRVGTRGVCRDVTAQRLREAELAEASAGDSTLAHVLATMGEAIEPNAVLETACATLMPALSASGCRLYRARDDGALRPIITLGAPPAGTSAATGMIVADACYRERLTGRIELWRDPAAGGWNAAEHAMLDKVADQLGAALAELEERETLERLSATDPLTDLLNRRAFAEKLEKRVALAAAQERGGALLYIDLDHFKQINDRGGHAAGDSALRAVATLLRRSGRAADLVARIGGDEFALWMDDVDGVAARKRAERIMAAVGGLTPASPEGLPRLGMSIGLALFDPRRGEAADALVRRADAAMYTSKRAGRSCITEAEPAGAVA
ncbi:MAG: sensor domain-containing diguanylate cyclase [Alphaproteobacteria bacterium]|nr:sensor domain-containing diguanylate cyclase [Alphaproteobacteria bacterium]